MKMQYRKYESTIVPPFIVLSLLFLFAGSSLSAPNESETPSPSGENSIRSSKPLRDPFWEVGYFPSGWGSDQGAAEKKLSTEEWDAPAAQLKVNGVSRMGNRVMALINGTLYSSGDVVEIVHRGKIFQWKIAEIKSNGDVQFERHKISSNTPH
jgi:hypothetical protein